MSKRGPIQVHFKNNYTFLFEEIKMGYSSR